MYTHTISHDCYSGIMSLDSQEDLISARLLALIELREGLRGYLDKHSLLHTHDASVFISSLPVSIPSSSEGEKCVLSMKQLRRDIERDVIVINGVKMLGSAGLEAVVEDIGKAVDYAFSSSQRVTLSDESKRAFSLACLGKAARTNSGGQSFQALQVSLVIIFKFASYFIKPNAFSLW